jgi:hypothetical protein
VTGIVQVVAVDDEMSQFIKSTEKVASLYLIDTVNPVITEPPLSGDTHVIITLSGLHKVIGATGRAGS